MEIRGFLPFKGLAFLLLGLFIGCNNEDPEPIGAFDNGLLVLNEGAFLSGNSSMSFVNVAGEVSQGVFSEANGGLALGDIGQSLIETDAHFIVTVNNSNLLHALNKEDLTMDYSIETLGLPRYVAASDDTGYVTEWVSFTDEGRVTAFDLKTGEVLAQQTTGFGAEFPFLDNRQLYVSNSFESTVTIMDEDDLNVIAKIQTGPSPAQIVKTASGELWMVCTGGFDENFAPANNGVLQQISNNEISRTINLNLNVSSRLAVEDNSIYYYTGSTVYALATQGNQITEVLTDDQVTGYYGITIDSEGAIYMADNKGFQGAGEIIKYTSGGLRDVVYTVGIGPNTILIR